MASCVGLWFLPVVSGPVCALIEAKLIREILETMGCYSEAASGKVYWFFRQKTFFLLGGTYLPVLGVPLQLFETYGIGQFAIHCALRPDLLTDDAWLEQSWKEVAPDIFSGEHAVQSYEQFTGSTFPNYARGKFIATVNFINQLYLYSQRFPGADKAQEGLAKIAQEVMRLGADGVNTTAEWMVDAATYVRNQANALSEKVDEKLFGRLAVWLAAYRVKLEAERAAKKLEAVSDSRE